jgi:hypothetical protein
MPPNSCGKAADIRCPRCNIHIKPQIEPLKPKIKLFKPKIKVPKPKFD